MTLTDVEQRKAHAAVWRRVHRDDSITNFADLATSFDQPVEWVMTALGHDVRRVSRLLRERRGSLPRRHDWREQRTSTRIRKKQIQGRAPGDHYGQHRTTYAGTELPEGF